MKNKVQAWGVTPLAGALAEILEVYLVLRSASRAPGMALMERALIRIAMSRRHDRP